MPISVASTRSAARLGPPLKVIVRVTLALEGRRPGEIAIVLTDDDALRDLNRRWRHIDRATDVLSFAYDERDPHQTGPSGWVNGDLVISLERMEAQARRFKVTRGRELARLAIHGALHLAGLDHQRAADRTRMRAREEKALARLRAEVRRLDSALALETRARA
jgi:probable rRNA maturation factor